jgi:hypothetical protein
MGIRGKGTVERGDNLSSSSMWFCSHLASFLSHVTFLETFFFPIKGVTMLVRELKRPVLLAVIFLRENEYIGILVHMPALVV